MTNQLDPLDQLRDALRRETQHINPVGLGVETVRRRGRRRRNRGRALVAVGATTCVAAVGATLVERNGASPDRIAVAAGSGGGAPPALEFRVVDGEVSSATTHFTTPGGVTYDLSTAPGVAPAGSMPGQAIYATSDGEHWSEADQGSPWISDLSARDGVLYAIGTAPGSSASDVSYRVGTSSDGGKAWSDTDLPFDLAAPNATVPLTRSSFVHIASGPTETVAVLSEQFSPDLSSLVPAHADGHTNVQTRMTNDGYDVVDMGSCLKAAPDARGVARGATSAEQIKARTAAKCTDAPVVGTISWSELGLSGPDQLAREEVLVSTDGTHWSSVPAPAVSTVDDLVADSSGFLMLAAGDNGSFGDTLLRSTDARSWTPVSLPAGLNVWTIAGDDIVGLLPSGAIETSTDAGTTWNTTSIASALPPGAPAMSFSAADAGPLGFAVLVQRDNQADADSLLFSVDGLNWRATDLAAAGQPANATPMQVTVGADHVSVDVAVGAGDGPVKTATLLGTPAS